MAEPAPCPVTSMVWVEMPELGYSCLEACLTGSMLVADEDACWLRMTSASRFVSPAMGMFQKPLQCSTVSTLGPTVLPSEPSSTIRLSGFHSSLRSTRERTSCNAAHAMTNMKLDALMPGVRASLYGCLPRSWSCSSVAPISLRAQVLVLLLAGWAAPGPLRREC